MNDIDTIVEAVANRLTAHRGDFYHSGVWVALLRLLAEGKPVSFSQVAEVVGQSMDKVEQILSCCTDLEIDDHNNITGMGLSLNPTPHQFQINDHTLFTWCALDTILYAVALNRTIKVISTCPITQTEIRLRIKPDGITNYNPATAMISIAIPAVTEVCCRSNFCDQGRFFSMTEAAQRWLATNGNMYLLPVQTAFQVGYQVVNRLHNSQSVPQNL